jgi:transcription antitermination factor NusG
MTQEKVKRPETVHNLELFKQLVMGCAVEWVVIHTNPKCEKRAEAGLMAKGLLAYLPMECIERQYGLNTKKKAGGTYVTRRPMFSRYLFAGIDRSKGQTVDDVRSCDGVEGVVCFCESGVPARVSKADLCRVIDVSHGTYEGEKVPDGFIAWIAELESGCMLGMVKGAWAGIDFAFTGYDEAKRRVHGTIDSKIGKVLVNVPVDAVKRPEVSKVQDDSSDPSGTGESIHHTNGATEAADPAN